MAGAEEGGAETYFSDLVLALGRAGLTQRVATRPHAARISAFAGAGIEVTTCRFGGVFDVSTRARLSRAFAEWKPDIVQTWMNRATRHCPRGPFTHVGWLGGYYHPKYFRACEHVVGVTADIVGHLRASGWAEGRAHYLPTFAPMSGVPGVPRQSLTTPDGAPLIVALGRLHPKKGFDVLLDALAQVPSAWLWLAGSGELRRELERQCAERELTHRVRFLGWRNDREALLAAADLCVLPSRYEPFGTVMIEAWAAAKPLIAAASAGPRALIRDGVDGLLVPIDDAPALAAAIRRIIGDPALARTLAANGHAEYRTRFAEQAVVQQYLAFYEAVSAPA